MVKEDVVLMSRNRVREQLTGPSALLYAQKAFNSGRHPDAERLLTIAHDLFTAELLHDYAPSSAPKP